MGILCRKRAIAVFKDEGHLGHAQGFIVSGTVTNNILHVPAPQLFGTLLAHGPPDSVHDIALATSVRPHNCTYAQRKRNLDPVHERLESHDAYLLNLHANLRYSGPNHTLRCLNRFTRLRALADKTLNTMWRRVFRAGHRPPFITWRPTSLALRGDTSLGISNKFREICKD